MSDGRDTLHPERDRDDDSEPPRRGPLSWFAQNPVAANIVMLLLLGGGLLMVLSGQIQQEVFPEVELDMVVVNVPYPGASPEEVEQGVIRAIEEEVRGLDGVKEVRATAAEGVGIVTVELVLGTNPDRALSDVKSAVDRITSFPENVEEPVVSLATNRREVIELVISGDQSEEALRALAEQVRDELLQNEHITQVDLSGVRPLEISIEVPRDKLRKYDLTLDQIADRIRAASVDLPAGDVETQGGEILLRTKERREYGSEFADITVLGRPDGTKIKLRDIADVEDGFKEVDRKAFLDGKRSVMVNVYRVGDETPLEVSDAVRGYLEEKRSSLPPNVDMQVWSDRSEMYQSRINLLLKNAYIGLALVLLTLGVFLEMRLAFWVTLGIPISFLGGLLFMPASDVSLNMISLFAFIVTLGMVVDDAIVAGESIYRRRREGMPRIRAAITGIREVAVPITFAIVTTCIAFAPMLFVPGVMGKFFRVIPIVVILVLLMSLVEALVILPAHLGHSKLPRHTGWRGWLHRQQQKFSTALERFIEQVYKPFIYGCLRWRYLTLAVGVALLLGTLGLVMGGRLQRTFMPKIEDDEVTASLEMPVGTSARETRQMQRRIQKAANRTLHELGKPDEIARGVFAELGNIGGSRGGPRPGEVSSGSHYATVEVALTSADEREFSAAEFAKHWRRETGDIPGAESLKFDYRIGASSGDPIDFELSHSDDATLRRAADDLAGRLREYTGVKDVDNGFTRGKEQLDFKLTPEGRAMGLTEGMLARKVRGRFFGAEALRQQRGRNEVRVYVRLPKKDRRTLHTIEEMIIQTPGGGEIPLEQAATVNRSRAPTEITRTNARRTVNVTGDVIKDKANANEVVSDVEANVLPELESDYPGLSYELGGEQEDQQESMESLAKGFAFALVAIFGLLAIVFRSYIQPLIVMFAIPFGMVGAAFGHILMGFDLSLVSMMGIVALSGVVVNDSLILVVAVNEFRHEGQSLIEAVVSGGQRRFRPILLTSLTTFFGLMPMIVETSIQARFLIPMAISLGFGVLFATFITLILVPAIYLAIEDVRGGIYRLGGAIARWYRDEPRPAPTPGE